MNPAPVSTQNSYDDSCNGAATFARPLSQNVDIHPILPEDVPAVPDNAHIIVKGGALTEGLGNNISNAEFDKSDDYAHNQQHHDYSSF